MKIPEGRTEAEYLRYMLTKLKKDHAKLLDINWQLKNTLESIVEDINKDTDRLSNLLPVIEKHFNKDASKARILLEKIQILTGQRIVRANQILAKVKRLMKKDWVFYKDIA